MFNAAIRSDRFLAPRGQADPRNDQAEAVSGVVPSHSVTGTKFRLGMLYSCPSSDTPQTATHPERGTRDWRGSVVRDQKPLFLQTGGYRDFIGAFVAKAAKTKTVLEAIRYQGQLPLKQQPTLTRPDPWSDPTRGLP